MEKVVKIGELNFHLKLPQDPEEGKPTFEVENDASAVFVSVNQMKAIELRNLLNDYIEWEATDVVDSFL